ncbi:MAG: penicillin-binding protein 2 [Thermoleophilia bacterium]|nr:penicillin-binding protein 2 [Thermoleophilia bacterium]
MRDFMPTNRSIVSRAAAGAQSQPVAIRIAVASVVGAVLFSVLVLRLWALTVMSGSEYARQAVQNQLRQIPVEAPRGPVLDRTGRPMVSNRAAREVVVNVDDIKATRTQTKEQRIVWLARNLSNVLGVPNAEITKKIEAGRGDTLTPIVVDKDLLSDDVLFYLEEHSIDFPGVDVRNRFVRSYVDGSAAAHMLGQVGEVSPDQLKGKFSNLKPGDHVGQSGLESAYDPYLRGTDGYNAIEVDASGVRQGPPGRGLPATPGRSLRLTVDSRLQHATEKGLAEGITSARREHFEGTGGAAVAIDPRNGDILALASNPTYDPNIFVTAGHDSEVTQVLQDKRTPLSNRAIGGLYPPGSTYKVVTGLAALKEGYITPDTLLDCPASKKVSGTVFKNWTPEALGSMNLAHALEVSCDTYFYQLGLRFYNMQGSKLQGWSRTMGLGSSTGVDLPGEQEGTVPDPAWRKQMYKGIDSIWSTGHSVNLSIGQGDLLVTPLQMTSIYAAIANGGTMYEPQVAQSVEDASGKRVLKLPRGKSTKLPFSKTDMDAVHEGLYLATHSGVGTGSAVFSTFSIPVAGKTGTAEKGVGKNMAWFCGYAPANNPTIAACAIVENGGHGGTSAAPVVLRMFQNYFHATGGTIAGAKTD